MSASAANLTFNLQVNLAFLDKHNITSNKVFDTYKIMKPD